MLDCGWCGKIGRVCEPETVQTWGAPGRDAAIIRLGAFSVKCYAQEAMMNYAQQIKHPLWQKKRLEVLELHNFQCQTCRAKNEELHVHHPYYKRGAMIWDYEKTELECLCFRCHKEAHLIDEEIKKALAVCRDKRTILAAILKLNSGYAPKKPKKKTEIVILPTSSVSQHCEDDDSHHHKRVEELMSLHGIPRADAFFMYMREFMGDGNGEN
jgi:hypothetical protein